MFLVQIHTSIVIQFQLLQNGILIRNKDKRLFRRNVELCMKLFLLDCFVLLRLSFCFLKKVYLCCAVFFFNFNTDIFVLFTTCPTFRISSAVWSVTSKYCFVFNFLYKIKFRQTVYWFFFRIHYFYM